MKNIAIKTVILFVTSQLLFIWSVSAQSSAHFAVKVSAEVQEEPPQIRLDWPLITGIEQYVIYKREYGQKEWGYLANLTGLETQYTDDNVIPGRIYEYGIFKKPSWIYDTIMVTAGDDLVFQINDSWGDGICCWLGNGYYQLLLDDSTIVRGGNFQFVETYAFQVPGQPGETKEVIVNIYFDSYPDETTWKLSEGDGTLITRGGPYEYPEYSYITAGIKILPVEQRGTILLLLDDVYPNPLQTELERFQLDLICDGWKVKTKEINRAESVQEVKAKIISECSGDPSINTLLLFGHIPVPYSGNIAMDGHADHVGAWPADQYYADIDGEWTDEFINNTSASRPANHNIPGDGKFDQSFLPSDVDLMIGRIDLTDLPAFAENDMILMQKYLNKNHAYRHGLFDVNRKALIQENLVSRPAHAMAWRNFSPMFGMMNVESGNYLTQLQEDSFLCSFGSGGSYYTGCGGVVTTNDCATKTLNSVFTMLFGSYFGDWDNTNNILRSPLAGDGFILTNFWACIPCWKIHPMGIGYTIGHCTMLTQNTTSEYSADYGDRYVHSALMGDPTLRLHIVKPPSNLNPENSGFSVILNWTASPDDVLGYYVYRTDTLSNDFLRIHDEIITSTGFTDHNPPAGDNLYMVKAIKLETSACGSYLNLSQGIIGSIQVNIDEFKIPRKPEVIIYPNPGRDIFYLETKNMTDGIRIEVMDISGTKLLTINPDQGTNRSKYHLDLEKYAKGIYFIKVITTLRTDYLKIIKF